MALVERLREHASRMRLQDEISIFAEAAAEIERLKEILANNIYFQKKTVTYAEALKEVEAMLREEKT